MSNEKDMDEIFSFDNSTNAGKGLIKRAKRKSNLRMVGMSVLTITLVSIVIVSLKLQLAPEIFDKAIKRHVYYNNVFGADGFYGDFKSYFGLTNCESDVVKYKIINGKPVTTENVQIKGGFFGNELNRNSMKAKRPLVIISDGSELRNMLEGEAYTDTGERVMKFYHPEIEYKNYSSDINNLDKIQDGQNIEMSLSFDKEYSIDEVKDMIPSGITLNWYWVNTFNGEKINSLKENKETDMPNIILNEFQVVGFDGIDKNGRVLQRPEEKFINTINDGIKIKGLKDEFKGLYDSLKGENGIISKNNIKIIGVVVSGNKDTLKSLVNNKNIKASSFGIISKEY